MGVALDSIRLCRCCLLLCQLLVDDDTVDTVGVHSRRIHYVSASEVSAQGAESKTFI